MEALKKILRQALAEQAQRVKLQDGKAVEFVGAQGVKQVPADTTVDGAYLQKLYAFLFPTDRAALQAQQSVKGVLNIPNVGKILLIAQPQAPASLRLYPPAGQALFEGDWAKLSNKTVALGGGPPQVTASAPVAPPKPTFTVGTLSANMFGGFIPAGLGTSPVAATAAPQAVAVAPAMTPMALPAMAPDLAFPDPAPMPTFAPSQPFAPIQIDSTTPVSVDFGPNSKGSAAISDGHNAIDPILIDMVKRKASDVHATCGEPICMRIDGDIVRITTQASTPERMEQLLLPIIPPRNLKEFAENNDTDFAYEIRGVGRFRVNIFRDKNGVGTVMRHIPSTILTAEQLNLSPAITKFCHLTKGLVLVTGPTGSGKSTTLAAMMDLVNKTRADHILTIEDPIEFVHQQQKSLINQREVHKHTGSFARALRAALREDPDIVLIGEMRDLETIAIAIETAETGHLVFGTLHTTTAVSTVDRIFDQFPTDRQEQVRMMLSSSLKGVVAQTLLKKKAGGRVAAHEILVMNDAVSAMVREGKNHMIPNHMQTQKVDGNMLLNESLAKLVKDGVVDVEEAVRKSIDKTSFLDIMKRMNIKVEGQGAPAPPGRTAPPKAS